MDPLLVRAARGERTERPPVWLMRQAGRHIPEYREIRSAYSFLEAIKTPEVAAEITLLPWEYYRPDGLVMFSDILTVLEPLGFSYHIESGVGPVVENPVEGPDDVDRSHDDVVRSLAYNGQEDIGPKGKAVFSLTPPFEEPVEPSIRHLDDDSTESKADDEIHIRPFRFVMEGRQVIEQRPTRRLAKAEIDAEDPDDAAIEAWIGEAMETWKAHIRENLAESVDIYSPQGMAFVDVEYAESE